MANLEKHIQRYVLDRLQLLENQGKAYFFRANSFAGRLVRYNGTQGHIHNAKPGCPDVIALINGRFVGIELKSFAGRQSKEQKQAQERIEALGGIYRIIRMPEDFEALLASTALTATTDSSPAPATPLA